MNDQNASPFLANLAEIFRKEGDTATADALDRQLQITASRALSEDEVDRVRRLRREAVHLNNLGAHDKAEPLYVEALSIVESALGPQHVSIYDLLNCLAGCRFNSGDFEAALEDYSRLRRILERDYGADDTLTTCAAYYVEQCRKNLRNARGALRLQTQMTWVLRQAHGVRSVESASEQERVRDIAGRLLARGRAAASVHLYERWIAGRLADALPDDEVALLDIRDYATALRSAGKVVRAASVLQMLVTMRNRRSAWDVDKTELLRALSEWQVCLAEMGDQRSATETAALSDSIASAARQAGQPASE